jgi:hypothetical protein
MQTGSSGTLIGWISGQTTFVPLWDRMEGAWLRTQNALDRLHMVKTDSERDGITGWGEVGWSQIIRQQKHRRLLPILFQLLVYLHIFIVRVRVRADHLYSENTCSVRLEPT